MGPAVTNVWLREKATFLLFTVAHGIFFRPVTLFIAHTDIESDSRLKNLYCTNAFTFFSLFYL